MAAGRPTESRCTAQFLAAALVIALPVAAAAGTIAEASPDVARASVPASSDAAFPFLRVSVEAQVGYDNDLLADPDGVGILEPVASSLAAIGPVLQLRRTGLFATDHRDRCEAQIEGGVSEYSEQAIGSDWNVRGSALYQAALSARALVEGSATYLHFRRRTLPLFDVDSPEVHLRVARATGDRWLLAGEVAYAQPVYPGRPLAAGGHQQDDRVEVTGSCLRSYRRHDYAAVRASWRTVDSNDPYVVQHGPLLEIRAGATVTGGWRLVATAAGSDRVYPNYPVLVTNGTHTVDTGETRRDQVLQLGLTAERRVSARVNMFAQAWGVHQWSNVEALAFGQARFVVGCQVEFWRAGVEDGSAPALPARMATSHPLAPEIHPDGVTFKVRAGVAQSVALVGGFNGWDEHRHLMQGPDADGVWRITVEVSPGTWRYAFVVDGKWVRPEGAPRYQEDGFGEEDGVLDLEAPAAPDPAP
jgi:hypothetical protein